MRLVSWNVNGIRAAVKNGFTEWLSEEGPDVVCIQETKAHEEQIPPELSSVPGYHQFYSRPERKGYSGVALLTKKAPESVSFDFDPGFDGEGRLVQADFGDFTLLNVYFPNGKASEERLRYKMDFYESFRDHCETLRDEGRSLVICGDVNTAHKEIDLARPKENESISGFLPEEREWMDRFLSDGYLDTLRVFDGSPGLYSWWSVRTRARERNVGWRIDYFLVSDDMRPRLRDAGLMVNVMGSDHCPIYLDIA